MYWCALRPVNRQRCWGTCFARDSVSDRKGLDRGANDYLVKPFSFELSARLRAMMRELLSVPGGNVLCIEGFVDGLQYAHGYAKRNGNHLSAKYALLELSDV